MPRKLTEYEISLIEIVHFLSHGSPEELGLTLKETLRWLEQPISSRQGLNALECLEKENQQLLREIKLFLNDRSGQ